ncbi:MAG: dipicolinate synthase subunit DpsA [Butyricicoccus sp.]|nr:dipicolinate synthase subunit DpsA [Butyricicoccus sp.]
MKRTASLALIGGDLRQAVLAEQLAADGHDVSVCALERHAFPPSITVFPSPDQCPSDVQAVILPMPVLRDEIHLNAPLANAALSLGPVLDALPPETLVLAGAVSDAVRRRTERARLRIIDYLKREELAIRNAVPTAEGAIQIAMEELPVTIQGLQVLVIGCGRIGQATAARLHSLGAEVTVSARRPPDFARIESSGWQALDTRHLSGHLAHFSLVINTVPTLVLGAADLSELPPGCLLLDLASKPGGIDIAAAAALGRRAIWALSLPGKVAPVSAAGALRDTIYSILQEEDIL